MNKILKIIVLLLVCCNVSVFSENVFLMSENDTLNKQNFDSLSFTTYTSPGGGFASGNNAYLDQAKAQEFRAGNLCNIYAVLFNFGFKSFSSLNDTSYVGINFYHLNNTGRSTVSSTASCPGNIFFKDSIKVADIDTINGNVLTYTNPIYTDSNFAIGIDFDQIKTIDSVALYTNKDGDAGSREQSWEKDISGNWFTLKYNWPLNVDFAIFPIVNTSVGLQALSTNKQLIQVWPNPSQGGVFNMNVGLTSIKNMQVYTSKLQLINAKCTPINTSNTQISFDGNAKGVYFVKVITEHGISVEKVIVE